MLEHQFIKQKEKSWTALEQQIFTGKTGSPERLAESFVEVTEDLSYSRTYYTHRLVRVYLNNMARSFFGSVYKNKKISFKGIKDFWKTELPLIIYSCKNSFLTAFAVFAIATAIGVFSTYQDPTFANHMLGEDYMDMTRENIAKGDPMAVYKGENDELSSFVGITINNVKVAFTAFVSGVLMGLGSLLVLLYNGIMLGSFQYFFISQNLARESILTIWMHGTLEISSIVIAGAAGLEMGKGLLFPGTYTRLQAFRLSSIKGLKILLSTVPLFIIAGFTEGFLTRQTDVGDGIRASYILICAAFIIGYYVIYPIFVAKNPLLDHSILDEKIEANHPDKPFFYGLSDTSQLFTDSIKRISKSLNAVYIILLLSSLIISIWSLNARIYELIPLRSSTIFEQFFEIFFSVYKVSSAIITTLQNDIIKVVALSLIQILLFTRVNIHDNHRESLLTVLQKEFFQVIQAFLLLIIFNLLLLIETGIFFYIYILLLPWIYMSIVVVFHEKLNLFKALSNSWSNCISGFKQMILTYGLIALSSYILLAFLNAPLIQFAEEFISMNLQEDAPYTQVIINVLTTIPLIAGLLLVQLWAFSAAVTLNKQSHEIRTGHFLHKKIKSIHLMKNGSKIIASILVVFISIGVCSKSYAEDKFSKEKWKEATKDITYKQKSKQKTDSKNDSKDESSNSINPSLPSFNLEGAQYVLWTIIIVFAAIILILIITNWNSSKTIFPKQKFAYNKPGTIEEEFLDWTPSKINEALANKDYKSAIRLTYVGVLFNLCDKQILIWHKEKTNKEYLKELHNTQIKHGFRDLTRKYEIAWFGNQTVGFDDYQQFELISQNIQQNISVL